ncbi:HNH endonuclease [Streptomyces sp. NPDC058412]|uniref:HNH endonuclease n=1 Tax=Streptomyces sp. NPDC058412 TaxID=3346486 RepID=UPI00364E8A26
MTDPPAGGVMDQEPPTPDYRDPDAGGVKVRLSAYLAAEVGEGGAFTLDQVREALPGVAQVDRRIRDLRDDGWIIESSRQTGTHQYRLVKIGNKVWDPQVRVSARRATVSRARRIALERDHYRCAICGFEAGPGLEANAAALEVAHVTSLAEGGTHDASNLLTLCANCHRIMDRVDRPDVASVAAEVASLSETQKTILLAWMARGHRTPSPVEQAWTAYRRLPVEGQQAVRGDLAAEIERLAGGEETAR